MHPLTRLSAVACIALLAASCAGPTFHERARITSLPTDVSRTLVLMVDYESFSGDAKPGPVPGQTVTVTSATGKRLTCTFRSTSWRYDGPGGCVDPNGGQYDMIFDRNAFPGL